MRNAAGARRDRTRTAVLLYKILTILYHARSCPPAKILQAHIIRQDRILDPALYWPRAAGVEYICTGTESGNDIRIPPGRSYTLRALARDRERTRKSKTVSLKGGVILLKIAPPRISNPSRTPCARIDINASFDTLARPPLRTAMAHIFLSYIVG